MRLWAVVPVVWLGIGHAQSTGTFTPTGSMGVPREFHTATLLPDGKVLIAGGFSYGGGPYSTWPSAEIYDPSKGSFTATGDMTAARQMHTATLLPNGKVPRGGGWRELIPSVSSAMRKPAKSVCMLAAVAQRPCRACGYFQANAR